MSLLKSASFLPIDKMNMVAWSRLIVLWSKWLIAMYACGMENAKKFAIKEIKVDRKKFKDESCFFCVFAQLELCAHFSLLSVSMLQARVYLRLHSPSPTSRPIHRYPQKFAIKLLIFELQLAEIFNINFMKKTKCF